MQTPEFFQAPALARLLQGAAAGIVATLIVGFTWGGWVTGGTAKAMASNAAEKANTLALAPVCAKMMVSNTEAMAKFKAETDSSWKRETIVRETIKQINGKDLSSNLVDACQAAVWDGLKVAEQKSQKS
jgi:hypothetical protein